MMSEILPSPLRSIQVLGVASLLLCACTQPEPDPAREGPTPDAAPDGSPFAPGADASDLGRGPADGPVADASIPDGTVRREDRPVADASTPDGTPSRGDDEFDQLLPKIPDKECSLEVPFQPM